MLPSLFSKFKAGRRALNKYLLWELQGHQYSSEFNLVQTVKGFPLEKWKNIFITEIWSYWWGKWQNKMIKHVCSSWPRRLSHRIQDSRGSKTLQFQSILTLHLLHFAMNVNVFIPYKDFCYTVNTKTKLILRFHKVTQNTLILTRTVCLDLDRVICFP